MLIELTESNLTQLKSKVVLYECNSEYLKEIFEEYSSLIPLIQGIVEPNARYRQILSQIPFISTEELQSADFKITDILITSDYYEEAYEKLLKLDCSLPEDIYYYTNKESRLQLNYRKKLENLPLKDMILFRSGPHQNSYVPGSDFSDNARAVFEYMLSIGLNEEYKLVWLVKNPSEYKHISDEHKNVEFIGWDWEKSEDKTLRQRYFEALFLSKYILFTDAYGFARNCRKDQIRIQLWHGCGFKTRTNFVSCEKRYEYNIVISELYKKIHKEIYGLRDDQVVITGYPKADWLFHPVNDDMMAKIGIPRASKYIFWLPTFRAAKEQLAELNEKAFDSDTGLPIVSSMDQLEEINEILAADDTLLILKLHPFQDESKIHLEKLSNIVSLRNEDLNRFGLQINQVLGNAYALISDYSSVATEYLLLDRPMAFTVDDIEEYKVSRGFVFDDIEEYLPGTEIHEYTEFRKFIEEIVAGVDLSENKRKKVAEKMLKYRDDQSSRRVTEWMLSLN